MAYLKFCGEKLNVIVNIFTIKDILISVASTSILNAIIMPIFYYLIHISNQFKIGLVELYLLQFI